MVLDLSATSKLFQYHGNLSYHESTKILQGPIQPFERQTLMANRNLDYSSGTGTLNTNCHQNTTAVPLQDRNHLIHLSSISRL